MAKVRTSASVEKDCKARRVLATGRVFVPAASRPAEVTDWTGAAVAIALGDEAWAARWAEFSTAKPKRGRVVSPPALRTAAALVALCDEYGPPIGDAGETLWTDAYVSGRPALGRALLELLPAGGLGVGRRIPWTRGVSTYRPATGAEVAAARRLLDLAADGSEDAAELWGALLLARIDEDGRRTSCEGVPPMRRPGVPIDRAAWSGPFVFGKAPAVKRAPSVKAPKAPAGRVPPAAVPLGFQTVAAALSRMVEAAASVDERSALLDALDSVQRAQSARAATRNGVAA
jgi:hypothetical protein